MLEDGELSGLIKNESLVGKAAVLYLRFSSTSDGRSVIVSYLLIASVMNADDCLLRSGGLGCRRPGCNEECW